MRKRIHSFPDYFTPVEFEERWRRRHAQSLDVHQERPQKHPISGVHFAPQSCGNNPARARRLARGLDRVRIIPVDWANNHLERAAAQVEEQGVQVKAIVIEGRPNVFITQLAESNQINLIMLRARGWSGFSRWLMGSAAGRVVRGATVPVLLMRAA